MNGGIAIAQLNPATALTGTEIVPVSQAGYARGTTTGAIATLATQAMIPRSYLSGFILSNDVTTPNTVLDISAGQCADSTNLKTINLSSFTKSTGGAWTTGSGSNGMGVGLTVAPNTWYHVFAILYGAITDVYFDTSVAAANAPVGTTAYRRIGSIKTDGSSHILAFFQDEDTIYWGAGSLDENGTNVPGSTSLLMTLDIPPGVKVRPLVRLESERSIFLTSPDQPDVEANSTFNVLPGYNVYGYTGAAQQVLSFGTLYSNTAQQLRARCFQDFGAGQAQIFLITDGWIDTLGRRT